MSNAKISKILRKYSSSTFRELNSLVSRNLLGKNKDNEYYLTSEGLELIEQNVSNNIQCEKIQNFVHNLKSKYMLYGATSLFVTLFGTSKPSQASAASSSATSSILSVPTLKITGIIAIIAVGGIFGGVYTNSYNALFEMENLVAIGNQQYENKQYETSFDTFSKIDKIFLSTEFSPDHNEHAEYLHLQSLMGMGSSLQSQSNFGQIQSFSEKSEEYYLYAIALYEGKHDTENAWIGRGINTIYETPGKSVELCSMFDSINSHMCQGEAYAYMYVTGKVPLEKVEEQFEISLDMAGSEKQKSKIEDDIDQIYKYYKLSTM